MSRAAAILAAAWVFGIEGAHAQEQATPASASFQFNGARIEISRGVPASEAVARFSPQSSGEALAPMQAAPGVDTLGEVEVLSFLIDRVAANTGLMVDARRPEARAQGFVPGSVNLPADTVHPDNSYRDDILTALGARALEGSFNFSDARALLIYDAGPASDDAARLIRHLRAAGYPADKLKYYRGGMQIWAVLGFSIEEG